MTKEKVKVVDTSSIMEGAESIFEAFPPQKNGGHTIVIFPQIVLSELDEHKASRNRGKSEAARVFFRTLREVTDQNEGNIFNGVTIGEPERPITIMSDMGYITNVLEMTPTNFQEISGSLQNLGSTPADRRLLEFTYALGELGIDTELITNDEPLRQIAIACGLQADDWRDLRVLNSLDNAFRGWREVQLDGGLYAKIENEHFLTLEDMEQFLTPPPFPNEYFITTKNIHELDKILRWDAEQERFVQLVYYFNRRHKRIKARNARQACLMDALRNPYITLVTAVGEAGTGKTFLAEEAALDLGRLVDELEENTTMRIAAERAGIRGSGAEPLVDRMILTRPTEGEDELGYLPGDIHRKFDPWIMPIRDNFVAILRLYGIPLHDSVNVWNRLTSEEEEGLEGERIIDILPFQYARGASIARAVVIADEMQNGNRGKGKTICTRPAEGTRLVLTGDPTQIDPRYLHPTNNALIYVNEVHKGDDTAATIWFTTDDVVRSPRAQRSAELFRKREKRR